ncbi:hypothetical protein WAK64_07375 [Bacillus spongiae]|uniref:Uncharacterized protein n=1 Tax=Bacillus spongiae TaxID=2683610 RepID=A0ABU8HCU9_9BACI
MRNILKYIKGLNGKMIMYSGSYCLGGGDLLGYFFEFGATYSWSGTF